MFPAWNQWPPELKDRNPDSLNQIQKQYSSQIQKEKFIQYSLYRQWMDLKNYCNHKNIKIIGDMPIYLSMDSAEVWANPHIFKLDDEGQPLVVSGVPPDYFSSQGQLWGNPVYDWDRLKADRYSWWSNRLAHNFSLFDLTRIDHFRGLVAYWEIPATEKNAVNGSWVKVPVYDFFDHLESQYKQLPIIAEDLGHITDDVREVLKHYRFSTMKVLLFAFDQDDHAYMPHNYDRNCFAYTGTHDNNTAVGWYLNEATAPQKERLAQYTGNHIDKDNVHAELMRLAMQSVAEACIIPMQDVLGLDSSARMNLPATVGHNWKWALCPQYRLDHTSAQRLTDFTRIYGRL
ncbi:MAG: 4-alpha-glucanotransferase [Actinomycetota bacterium]|nr:4-alpha-glucanotransferase [Actinomycetota bacterium]